MDGPPAKRYNTRVATKNSEIEQPLLEWFYVLRTENKEVNGQMILQGAKKLGADADALNESWLQRWHERHGIHYKALHGEAGDCSDVEEWLVGIKPLLNSYKNQDVYNCDETALFWRMINGKSFIAAHEIGVAGRKKNKSRVTIFVACSMAGEKLLLLCIGTSSNSRWPVVLGRKTDPPVDYRSSAKDRGRRCLLLVDSCPPGRKTRWHEDQPPACYAAEKRNILSTAV